MEVDPNADLPLMSNVDAIRARHYLLKFELKPLPEVFECEVVIFFEALSQDNKEAQGTDFECVLDCCDLDFQQVSELILPEDFSLDGLNRSKDGLESYLSLAKTPLQYTVDKWSIRVKKPGCQSQSSFPSAVHFKYSTRPGGRSLLWRRDRNGQPCVFTAASNINNRSLFPCQVP